MQEYNMLVAKVNPTCFYQKSRIEDGFVYKEGNPSATWKGKIRDYITKRCWKWLVSHHMVEEQYRTTKSDPTYESVSVDLDHLVHEIMSNEDDIMRLHNRRVRMIVCNRHHLGSMKELALRDFRYPSNKEVRFDDRGTRSSFNFMGIEVVVVPWVKEIILIPEVD